MKQLGAQFSESQELKGKDVADVLGVKPSNVFRAALMIGLQKIEGVASKSPEEAKELVLMTDARAKM